MSLRDTITAAALAVCTFDVVARGDLEFAWQHCEVLGEQTWARTACSSRIITADAIILEAAGFAMKWFQA